MEIELSDISGLPEALKPLVQDNKLDLSKLMPTEDLTGLKTALQKERENAQAWSKFGKPDELASKIADLEAKAAGTGKGAEDAQAKLDAMAKGYEGQIADRDGRLAKLMQANASEKLRAELAKAGVVPEGLDMLATFAAARIQFHDDGSPKVMTSDGKPMIGSGADHGATLADLAKELAGSMPYLVKDAGAGGSGKQPGSNGGTPNKQTVTRTDWNTMSHPDRAAFSKSGGKVVD